MDRAGSALAGLDKSPTGIEGLDEITAGGLPKGRPTLVCGGAGCGKTLLAMEFLVHGAVDFGEPGVFVSFEESAPELAKNVASLGFDLEALARAKQVAVKHIRLQRNDIDVSGDYDLEGLFIQLGMAVDSVGAKRIVLDTIETLFGAFPNDAILRSELQRLFLWLKDRGLTAIVTGERGEKTLTRHGLEEYVADCVILLDHRIADQIATRRLRIVKYRGSVHGADEYPFLIDEQGISVLPITSLTLQHEVCADRVSSGVPRLDAMLGGQGFYRGSSILYSGTAGAGKTSLAASFAHESCRRGERVLFLAFEESEAQLVRNMRSIGMDLQPWVDQGLLRVVPGRSTACGLELHLATIHKAVNEFRPSAVVIDPISTLVAVGSRMEVKAMLTRLMDYLKGKQVTAIFTSLTRASGELEETETHISSLADCWLLLRDIESSGERNRLFYLLKSRGMAHSNQLREFLITSRGIELRDVYLGPGGVLTGTARQAQEASESAASLAHARQARSRRLELERVRDAAAAEIAELVAEEARGERALAAERVERAALRRADGGPGVRA